MTTPHRLTLRPYQRDAVSAIDAKVRAGVRRPAVILPTGAGKTVVIADYVDRDETRARGRSLVIAHRTELIEQAAEKIRTVNPHLRVGIVKGSTDQVGADVIVGSVQTLASEKRRNRLRGIGTVVIDECHHATAASYLEVLRHFGCMPAHGAPEWPMEDGGAVAVGFTATMGRADGAALGQVWQDIAFSLAITDLMPEYLVRPEGHRVFVPNLDLGAVKKTRGDFGEGALGEALEGSLAPEKVAEAYRKICPDEQGILFAPTVSSAYAFAEALTGQGFEVAVVHGGLKDADRKARLQDFRDGKVQILSNCMVLTEGTDLPMAVVCVVARPTKNRSLYVQMVGRVLRLYPGKDRAIVLDVVGATDHHALVAPVELFGAPVKEVEPKADAELDELEEGADPVVEEEAVTVDTLLRGPTASRDVDLFHAAKAPAKPQWRRTYAGVWFIRAGDRYIIVLPSPVPGRLDVLWLHRASLGVSGWVARTVPDLGYAMAHAEDDVRGEEYAATAPESTRATAGQRAIATAHGIILRKFTTWGEAEGLIEVAQASARIDPHLPPHVRRG